VLRFALRDLLATPGPGLSADVSHPVGHFHAKTCSIFQKTARRVIGPAQMGRMSFLTYQGRAHPGQGDESRRDYKENGPPGLSDPHSLPLSDYLSLKQKSEIDTIRKMAYSVSRKELPKDASPRSSGPEGWVIDPDSRRRAVD